MQLLLPDYLPVGQIWPLVSRMFRPKHLGRPRKYHPRTIFEAILYLSKTGGQWPSLPPCFPPWKTVYHYFRKWTHDGLWYFICKKVREEVRVRSGKNRWPTGVSTDSQSVKTFFGEGAVGFDGHKKVKGRKRHLLTDSMGLLIYATCMAANIHDIKGGKMILNYIENEASLSRIRYLNADSAYRGLSPNDPRIRIDISSLPKGSGFQPLPQRWKIERSIAWSRGYRRTIIDYEKKVRFSAAWIYIAFIQIGAKKLGKLG